MARHIFELRVTRMRVPCCRAGLTGSRIPVPGKSNDQRKPSGITTPDVFPPKLKRRLQRRPGNLADKTAARGEIQ